MRVSHRQEAVENLWQFVGPINNNFSNAIENAR